VAETTNNQHFVPVFYLRGFTIPGEKSLIWEYDKQKKRYSKAPKSAKKICVRYRYYRQVREDGREEPDLLEHGFNHELEYKVASFYTHLFSRLADGNTEIELSPTEYGQFCFSVAIQYTRVPSFRDKMALYMKICGEQFIERIVEMQRKAGTLPPKIDELLQKEKLKVIIEKWGTVKTMIEASVIVANALMEKTPAFFRASPGKYFITSDNPVSYYIKGFDSYDFRQIEPINPNAEVFFPLNRNNAVVFFPIKSGYSTTNYPLRLKCLDLLAPVVRFLNVQTAIMAEEYIFAPERISYLAEEIP
jgi:hypothetical protein